MIVTLIDLGNGDLGFQLPQDFVDQNKITENTKVIFTINEDKSLTVTFED